MPAVMAALDRLPYGIVVAGGECQPLLTNAAAREMLRSQRAEWQRAMAQAAEHGQVSMCSQDGEPSPFVIPILLTDGGRAAAEEPHATFFLVDPRRMAAINEEVLRSIYRLTKAEARIAGMLLSGAGVDETAKALRVTHHTVRAHLKRIFTKTGSQTQVQLLRLLIRSGALLAVSVEGEE